MRIPDEEAAMDKRAPSRKKSVNLSIDANLLAEAKSSGTNLSALLESALERELRERLNQKWRDENRDAIEAYNKFVEEHGLLSDEWRSF
jgi:antitoxin CcdA